jgi:hypothetical protein
MNCHQHHQRATSGLAWQIDKAALSHQVAERKEREQAEKERDE